MQEIEYYEYVMFGLSGVSFQCILIPLPEIIIIATRSDHRILQLSITLIVEHKL